MVNYSNGKIYKIVNDVDNEEYVGSTCKPRLCQRMVEHRSSMLNPSRHTIKLYQHMKQVGIEHFRIELIETYPCNSKDELTAREGHWQRELNASLNTVINGRTKQEWTMDNSDRLKQQAKMRYEKNKEAVKQRVKQYGIDNIEKIRLYKKGYQERRAPDLKLYNQEYYKTNLAVIKQQRSEMYECECGDKFTKSHKTRHQQSQSHQLYIQFGGLNNINIE